MSAERNGDNAQGQVLIRLKTIEPETFIVRERSYQTERAGLELRRITCSCCAFPLVR